MKYSTLAFSIHKKCSAHCSMCCFECSPKNKEMLDIERIKEYINESKHIKSIKNIAFTGGEPFLEYTTLKKLVELASMSGKLVSCSTNGYFASSYEVAFRIIKILKA